MYFCFLASVGDGTDWWAIVIIAAVVGSLLCLAIIFTVIIQVYVCCRKEKRYANRVQLM